MIGYGKGRVVFIRYALKRSYFRFKAFSLFLQASVFREKK